MKILQLAFSIVLASALSGCAYNGYQHGYAGYSSGYGSAYSTGYGVQESYYYPAQTYYQSGGGVHYQQLYGSPGYSNRAALHRGHNYNRDWRTANPHRNQQNPGGKSNNAGRWQNHASGHVGQPQNHTREQKWGAQARSRQNTSAMKHSWQSAPTSNRMGSTQHRPDNRNRRNHSQR
jgi:hypothetical protein